MNELNLQNTPGMTPRFQQRTPALGLGGLPSFARALRQRGLMAQIDADGDESWTPALSVFEAHLRRQAMEQAFASLRGDSG
jgi:predicted amidohydrolase YtcJ